MTIHNPDIGGLLPVFVHDTYEGFEVKTFAELSDARARRYIEANVAAVRELVASLGGVDAALANHLVMGPVILARAGLRYALKVHGSDLSYTVLPDARALRPLRARRPSRARTASSSARATSPRACARPSTTPRSTPRSASARRAWTPRCSRRSPRPPSARARGSASSPPRLQRRWTHGGRTESGWDRDTGGAADALEWFAEAPGRG